MTREIKFRAWLKPRWDDDDDANTMYYDIQNSYDMLGDVKPYDPMGCFSGWLDEDIAIVEQYTGLKDKNGKEIYEGDIIAQTLIDDPFTKKYPIYVVRWDEEFLSWALKDVSGDDGNDTDLHFFIEEWKKCEVIGNIHESNMEELCQKELKINIDKT